VALRRVVSGLARVAAVGGAAYLAYALAAGSGAAVLERRVFWVSAVGALVGAAVCLVRRRFTPMDLMGHVAVAIAVLTPVATLALSSEWWLLRVGQALVLSTGHAVTLGAAAWLAGAGLGINSSPLLHRSSR